MAIISERTLTWYDVFGETYLESALKLIKLNIKDEGNAKGKYVYITIGEQRCSEHGGNIDEMYCRVASTMQIAKSSCQDVEWKDDDEELARSKWKCHGDNVWERVVIIKYLRKK